MKSRRFSNIASHNNYTEHGFQDIQFHKSKSQVKKAYNDTYDKAQYQMRMLESLPKLALDEEIITIQEELKINHHLSKEERLDLIMRLSKLRLKKV